MSSSEKQISIIRDILLPVDFYNRYDLYFTDQRVAIVCMGRVDRYVDETFKMRAFPSSAAAVTPPLTYLDDRKSNQKAIEEELRAMSLDQILRLSKKSCQYTNNEIEALKLGWGKKPKFVIQSEDCESKFTPDKEQFKQLIDLLSTKEPLSSKLAVAGNWKELQKILASVQCSNCKVINDLDAICCVNCGQKIEETPTPNPSTVSCSSCGTKNSGGAFFCKQCGASLTLEKKSE